MGIDRLGLGSADEADGRTMGEKAFKLLRSAILCGALEPGEALPMKDLARALRMSRMPIRTALAKLDRIGLVEISPGEGARVSGVSGEELEELYDIRLSVEVQAISAAAMRFGEDDVAVASRWLARILQQAARSDCAVRGPR